MKILLSIICCFILGTPLFAQTEVPNMDSIMAEIRKEQIELYKETAVDTLETKLWEAWRNGEEVFIIDQINNAILSNTLNPSHFIGMAALAFSDKEVSESESKNILTLFNKLKTVYNKAPEVNKYLIGLELQYGYQYYALHKINTLVEQVLALVYANKIDLYEESIRQLYSLRFAVLETQGKRQDLDMFVNTFYDKYPAILYTDYLLSNYAIGNYKLIAEKVKNPQDANPILLMIAGISHKNLKNDSEAKLFFDEILRRYKDPENDDRNQGLIPTIFEDGQVGSTSLIAEQIEKMTAYYFEKSDLSQACIALELLQNSFRSDEENSKFSTTPNQFLKDEGRIKHDKEMALKATAENKKIQLQIEKWQKLCK